MRPEAGHRRDPLRAAAAAVADRGARRLRAADRWRSPPAGARAGPCGGSSPSPCCCCGWPARGWWRRRRDTLPDIGLLVVDQTASMQVGERARLAEAARATLEAAGGKLPDLELRTITVPESGDAGTRLFAAIDRALADIPRSRLAGTIAITDGQVHDIPDAPPRRRAAERADPGQRRGDRPAHARHRGAGLRHRRQVGDAAGRRRGSRRAHPRALGQPDHPPRRRAAAGRERADRGRTAHRGADHAGRPNRGGTLRRARSRRGLHHQQPRRGRDQRRARPAARAAGFRRAASRRAHLAAAAEGRSRRSIWCTSPSCARRRRTI